MTLRLVSLCLDANDPPRLARFWAVALGWEIRQSADELGLVPTDGTRFGILFEPVSQEKSGQNRNHLDLTTASLDDQVHTVRRLVELGARHVDVGQDADAEPHVVLADPEGNEFCVIEPSNNFLAGCGRLGAINCDGSRETGHFWSAALGWPLVWDRDEETAIRAADGTGAKITWSGRPLKEKRGKNRLHLDVAPPDDGDRDVEVERLVSLGAHRIDIGQGDVDWVVMADPDGNEFCVLTPR